jgi:hypothetical protein
MKQSKYIKKACKLLKHYISFESASFTDPDRPYILANDEFTDKIRAATKLYIDSWIIPIIDYIESGNVIGLYNNILQYHPELNEVNPAPIAGKE